MNPVDIFIDIFLLLLMAAVAIAIVRSHLMFAVVMLSGIFSLLAAVLYVHLTAVDVAFTEAAVGAGVSTLLFLATLALTHVDVEEKHKPVRMVPLVIVVATGAMLIWGTLDMPHYGDPEAPANKHVAPRYIQESPKETGLPNMVTSVLASYRGYDTLGEVVVIFTAGAGVLVILGRGRRRWRPGVKDEDGDSAEEERA